MVDHTSLYKLKKRIGVDKLRIIINEEFIFLGSGKVAQWMLEDLTIPSIPVEAASGGNSKTGDAGTGGSVGFTG